MDIFLYDVIGDDYWGDGAATAKGLRDELAKASPDEPITLRINSPGGDVLEAVTMVELLAKHGGPVDAKIDGMAASAASFIAATVGRVSIAEGGLYMIHNPWSLSIGEEKDHRREADLLAKVRENLAAQYVRRSGKLSAEEVRAAMDAETWYTAAEALAAGFVDEVSGGAKAMVIPSRMGFRNAPKLPERGEEGQAQRSPLSVAARNRHLRRVAAEMHRARR